MPSTYVPGTDNRNDDGYYTIPEGIPTPEGWEPRALPSVTTVLSLTNEFIEPERWWTAQEFHELARASKEKRPWMIWHKTHQQMVEVHPGQVMLNMLPDHFGTNYGLHWMKMAGARELNRRANRGQIVHDAVDDYVLADLRIDMSDLGDYVGSLIERRGYTIKVEYVADQVWTCLAWLDRHLLEPYLCNSMVVNWEYGWAGTIDLVASLRGVRELPEGKPVQLDFKTSKAPYVEHRIQAATYNHAESVVLRKFTGEVAVQPYPAVQLLANVYIAEEDVKVYQWGGHDDLFGPDQTIEDSYSCFLFLLAAHYHFARGRSMSPTLLPSLALRRPKVDVLEAYRTRQEVKLDEPTLIPTESPAAEHPGATPNGDIKPRAKRRKATPKE